MKETEFVNLIFHTWNACDSEGAAGVVDALVADLPGEARARLSASWPWSLDGPPAFDMALGDESDVIRAAIEVKSPGAAVNTTLVSSLLGKGVAAGKDEVSQEIDGYVRNISEEFIAPHQRTARCHLDWDVPPAGSHACELRTGAWHACLVQGDVYRAYLPALPAGGHDQPALRRPTSDDLSEVDFIVVVPSKKSGDTWARKNWRGSEWHVVDLHDVVDRWADLSATHREIAPLVHATRSKWLG